MADELDIEAVQPIPPAVVEFILLGPIDDRRQLQDSPILGDVWLALADNPARAHDLLITPYRSESAGRVASEIASRLEKRRKGSDRESAGIAALQGFVAARLHFDEILEILIPLTQWWKDKKVAEALESPDYDPSALAATIRAICHLAALRDDPRRSEEPFSRYKALERYVVLAGLLLWAGGHGQREPDARETEAALRRAEEALADFDGTAAAALLKPIYDAAIRGTPDRPLIHQVSLNRRAFPALDRSVQAIKADAARSLFNVGCSDITWAILDSGIDTSHAAFGGRVRKVYDFANIREIVSADPPDPKRTEKLVDGRAVGSGEAAKLLKAIAADARKGCAIQWEAVEPFLEIRAPERFQPASAHGTHVAGILGASADTGPSPEWRDGVCPDIQLYDFRVLSRTVQDTEFAIIAALQFLRFLNERTSLMAIHGCNLSLSIPHDVRNYACGRTPICSECERVVESGVVVVAAAGNRGYHKFKTEDGAYEGYAAFSITDPGNADGVITVGSTHRHWPHTYGVSFFSSRGPTGDGRMKPDLVAPGERIHAPLPGGDSGPESGTSMAAPHVSGAAAMLMARYPELIGQPRRVKRVLCETATDLGRERSFQGHGMLDVLRAFQSI